MSHAVPPLSGFTTLRVGGAPDALIAVDSQDQAVQALADLDAAGTAYAPLGGGSNLVVADAGVGFTVVWLRHRRIDVISEDAGAVVVRVDAGQPWDEFVTYCLSQHWSGLEALSGIPGTVGATPIQNVGAYGHDVSECVSAVHVWDRETQSVCLLSHAQCGFGYRDSAFKRSRRVDGTARHVVLQVDFRLRKSRQSSPVMYAELASALGVELGATADLAAVREAVLGLRRRKGMVLDAADHDTWSVGSFFVNPVVSSAKADALPDAAPRWPVAGPRVSGAMPSAAPTPPGDRATAGGGSADSADAQGCPAPDAQEFKVSAAWLIENSGFPKGFTLPGSSAALSTKHTLAITNRGGATASQVLDLARHIQQGVRDRFDIELALEPVLWT